MTRALEILLVEIVGEDLRKLLVVEAAELEDHQVVQELVISVLLIEVLVFLPLQGLLGVEMLF